MVYRRTERVEARLADNRARILRTAHKLVVEGGFRNAQVGNVAAACGVATGSIYRYFPSRADLLAEVFRNASQHEVDVVGAVARAPGTPRERLCSSVETFVRRAIRGRRLAWALIAEPIDPAVEAERLRYRRAYAEQLSLVVRAALKEKACPRQDAEVTAACLVGLLAEPLVGPLAPDQPTLDEREDELVRAIVESAERMVFGTLARSTDEKPQSSGKRSAR
ncbi:MAG TPA: TetR/AcrR family transcriptional regulator [Polyangiales bacterium]|nr:TetR/AcrR family transcriptional regulator [Polyangiales bacterium]